MWANPWGGSWPIQQSAYQNMPHEQGKSFTCTSAFFFSCLFSYFDRDMGYWYLILVLIIAYCEGVWFWLKLVCLCLCECVYCMCVCVKGVGAPHLVCQCTLCTFIRLRGRKRYMFWRQYRDTFTIEVKRVGLGTHLLLNLGQCVSHIPSAWWSAAFLSVSLSVWQVLWVVKR